MKSPLSPQAALKLAIAWFDRECRETIKAGGDVDDGIPANEFTVDNGFGPNTIDLAALRLALSAGKHPIRREIQSGSSGLSEHQKSPEPSSLELSWSVKIDENPKLLRLQCSCGQIIEQTHTQSREGIFLTVFGQASQTSERSSLPFRSVDHEELRTALFGALPEAVKKGDGTQSETGGDKP